MPGGTCWGPAAIQPDPTGWMAGALSSCFLHLTRVPAGGLRRGAGGSLLLFMRAIISYPRAVPSQASCILKSIATIHRSSGHDGAMHRACGCTGPSWRYRGDAADARTRFSPGSNNSITLRKQPTTSAVSVAG